MHHFMEKLLDGTTVEWKKLGEATQLKRGKRLIKSQLHVSGKYAVYQNSMTPLGYYNEYNVKADTTFVISAGAAGEVGYSAHDFWAADDVYYFQTPNNIESKFVYYFLLTQQYKILAQVRRASIPRLSKTVIEKLQLPIPPLKVQREIVRILDNFTELTAELTAELSARRTQYSYYRGKLLSFDEDEVEWKTLGEVGEFIRGKRFVKNDMVSEGVPCIHYGEMYTYYNIWADKTKSFVSNELVETKKLRTAQKGDVVIVAAGETIEDIGLGTAWLGDEEVVIHDACFFYKSELDPKYVAFFTRTKQFHDQIKKHISSGKISAINAKGLSKVKIPIPPLEKQKAIVAILDKFDALTNSISEGLPKEIELRQKQYAYYRDLLLSFPKEEHHA